MGGENNLNLYSEIIKEELFSVIKCNENYSKYNFYVADERSFVKEKELDYNSIYFVFKIESSTYNFAESNIEFSIRALSEANRIEVVRSVLNEFVLRFNLTTLQVKNCVITQLYSSPALDEAFNNTDSSFRATFNIAGSFIIASDTIDISKIEYKDSESGEYINILFLKAIIDFSNNVLSEPQGDTYSRTTTLPLTQTITLSFNTYLLNNAFITRLLQTNFNLKSDLSTLYTFKITFNNGFSFECDLLNTSFKIDKDVAKPSNVSLSFAL